MYGDEMCPEHLVARHMAKAMGSSSRIKRRIACGRWMEGPWTKGDESLMIPPEDAARPGSASRAECVSAVYSGALRYPPTIGCSQPLIAHLVNGEWTKLCRLYLRKAEMAESS